MERSANYALVGVISTILLVALIVFILWLTNFALSSRYDLYDVVFHGPITGLSRGGDVQFNGIKVGSVSDISLDARDPNLVVAKVKVRSDTPVRQNSQASIEPQGITGVNYIQITAGTTDKPLLKDIWPPGSIPVIQSKPGVVSSLLTGGGTVMQSVVDTLSRADQVLSDDNIRKISGILTDVRSVTTELRERKAIIADADKTLKDADDAVVQIRDFAKSGQNLIDIQGKATLQKIGDAASQADLSLKDIREMINKLKGPTSNFATNGLPQLTSAIVTLQTSMRDLDRLVDQIQRDPRGFVGKAAARKAVVKP
jgi:phospholipid/cholesterol/gamma-HCH transport system substrate-binding protein